MRCRLISQAALCNLLVGVALPLVTQSAEPARGPCGQIVAICTSAGFVEHDAKQGYGLYKDCVDPVMRGAGQPRNSVKPLPIVSAELITACSQKNPNFGQGRKTQTR